MWGLIPCLYIDVPNNPFRLGILNYTTSRVHFCYSLYFFNSQQWRFAPLFKNWRTLSVQKFVFQYYFHHIICNYCFLLLCVSRSWYWSKITFSNILFNGSFDQMLFSFFCNFKYSTLLSCVSFIERLSFWLL